MSLTKVFYSMIAGSPANVIDFGADPTGATSSSDAIQAAIDSGAAEIYVPQGNYSITSPIRIRPNTRGLRLIGATEWDTLFIWNGVTAGNIIEVGESANWTTFLDHAYIENLQFRNATNAKAAVFVQTAAFQVYLRNLRSSNNTNAYSDAVIVLNQYNADVNDYSYPVRTTVDNCYFDMNGPNPGQERGIWVKSGIQVNIVKTHVEQCRISYQLGCDSASGQGFVRSISSVYIGDNSRAQCGAPGSPTPVMLDAIGIWVPNNKLSPDGASFTEVVDLRINNFQAYMANGQIDTPNQLGLKIDGGVIGLSVTNCIFDGASRCNYAVQVTNANVKGSIQNNYSARNLLGFIQTGSLPLTSLVNLDWNDNYNSSDSSWISERKTNQIQHEQLSGSTYYRFFRLLSGVSYDIGNFATAGSEFQVRANSNLQLHADYLNLASGASSQIFLCTDGATSVVVDAGASGGIRPATDNVKPLGTAPFRWSVVYAGTGAINTSDEREKQDIAALDASEKRVAASLKGLVKKFRFKDAVVTKGDGARIHVGWIAQEVASAFEAEGLDPARYGIVCYDQWNEQSEIREPVLDEAGSPTDETIVVQQYQAAGNRYGVRYDELMAFIIATM